MATSSKVKICPKCSSVLPSTESERCPLCGHRIKAAQTRFPPTNDIQRQVKLASEQITGGEKARAEQNRELQSDMVKYFTGCKEEEKIAILSDALNILRFAIVSQDTTDTTRQLTKYGKLIGKLALNIEEFSRSGGVLNVSEQLQKPAQQNDFDS